MELSESASKAGFQLLHVTRAESTNEAALQAVLKGADRFWLVADEQTMGRGRHGRSWASPPGNLYASLGLSAPCPPAKVPQIGFVAGLSLAEAILQLAPKLKPVLHLKWPNDCLISGRKCAGILLEGSSLPGGRTALVVGMGVNVAATPTGIDQAVSALGEHAGGVTAADLFEALADRISENLAVFDQGAGFYAVRDRWLRHALPLGAALRVRLPEGEKLGAFAGIDLAGHLLLEAAGTVETIMVGDVFPVGGFPTPETAARAGL
jgi:BirA family transcriptional regulator, biotin operon repressor / biotin---[acetyl-CoA-carboxylase] ligase